MPFSTTTTLVAEQGGAARPSSPPCAAIGATRRAATGFHVTLLALCTVVLLLSCCLSVRGQSRVVLPGLELALPELCMSKRVLGMNCPGCGLTRCFISLSHGRFASAWAFNPGGVWLFAIMAFQIPYRTLQLWRIYRGKPEWSLHATATWALSLLGALLVAQWITRLFFS